MGGKRVGWWRGGEDSINIVILSVGWVGRDSGYTNEDIERVRDNVVGSFVDINRCRRGITEGEGGQ